MLLAHDHSELDAALRALFSVLGDDDVDRSFKNLDLLRARPALHIRVENIHLFPLLLKASIRSGKAADVVRQQMTRLRNRFHAHNALEGSHVYHGAGALLARAEQTAQGLERELNNLPPRFRAAEDLGPNESRTAVG